MDSLGKQSKCVGSKGMILMAREPPWKQNGLLHMGNIKQILSAKSWNERRASHQPVFKDSCLIISHMCFPCLSSR